MDRIECFDVTIIGGGPAGLFSAFYSGLREMKTKIIEYQPTLGGKVHVYPEKIVWDVGGLPPVPGAELMENLVAQGLTFDPEVILNEKIESIRRTEEGIFELRGPSGRKHLSRTVIMAVGGGILKPQKLPIEGAEKFEITNLHYTVKSLKQFKDKTVIISGGGNSAIDWANELESIAKKVYITYRKDQFTGHEAQISRLMNSSVTCCFHTTITKLVADKNHKKIESIELANTRTGDISYLSVDDVVINHGYDRDSSLMKNSRIDIQLIDDYFIAASPMGESSIPGLYGAGDILKHDGKLHLIAGAFQDAANAVNKAKQFIEPEATEYGMVSSHNEIFAERNKKLVKGIVRKSRLKLNRQLVTAGRWEVFIVC
ncbi:NAD(P)/FAD-dependent oxidoreductase [Sediminibacillus massiliensis]|uniref:NAD(P)/FAD-dependent oxidoreductase n=1 Tax=Sediminibacillus massiliensis TaxID=1926277 RepID=UPI000988521E|nr:NAD(P)/FAD-dependent oxidoreductase [Sediminibacillus massiliensis]